MIEKGGHYGPHYMTPAGGRIRADLWQAFRLFLRAMMGGEKKEGRRRILPGGACDAHAAGWEAPAMPDKKCR